MAENEGRGRESAVPSVLKRLQEASLPKEKASRCADILADAKKSEKRAEELAA